MNEPVCQGCGAVGACAGCATCGRDPAKVNTWFAECSHVDCPHRRKAWSDGTGIPLAPPADNRDADPLPLDVDLSNGALS
jgi:hypothetical protein